MFLQLDCRHYLGDRPCRFHRLCEGCPHYTPMGPRTLIIKLGALGDVVRTACLIPGLAKADEPPHITWLTAPAARPLVERIPGVDRVLTFDAATLAHLPAEQFETVICLDKDPAPCGLAMRIGSQRRLGIGLSRHGTVCPLNEEADHYFTLGLDDELKFRLNRKSYPELIYEALALHYEGERYTIDPTPDDLARADAALRAAGLPDADTGPVIGINAGAGRVFANKAWRREGYGALIRELAAREPQARFILLGGADERELMQWLAATASGAPVIHPGCDHALGTFAALVRRCDVVVSGDTLAMHLAVAQRRRVVAIFGPTCEQEIDLFSLGEKVLTPIDCAPCYLRRCDKSPNCQDLNRDAVVLEAVARQLEAVRAGAGA